MFLNYTQNPTQFEVHIQDPSETAGQEVSNSSQASTEAPASFREMSLSEVAQDPGVLAGATIAGAMALAALMTTRGKK